MKILFNKKAKKVLITLYTRLYTKYFCFWIKSSVENFAKYLALQWGKNKTLNLDKSKTINIFTVGKKCSRRFKRSGIRIQYKNWAVLGVGGIYIPFIFTQIAFIFFSALRGSSIITKRVYSQALNFSFKYVFIPLGFRSSALL